MNIKKAKYRRIALANKLMLFTEFEWGFVFGLIALIELA